LVLLIAELRAACATSAVSSMTIVALPAPTPYAGLPELYAAFTIAGPPVAIVRSHTLINSRASGMLGRSTHCRRSAGAPAASSAARITRTVSLDVLRLAGCGEKITASLHLTANVATVMGVT
jgi:hypothetical protein